MRTRFVNSPADNSIAVLIKTAKTGDQRSFRRLYDQLNDKLFGFLVARLPNRADALDCLQEVFLDLWQALPGFQYRSDKEFYAFVFTLTRRKIARFYRSQQPAVELTEQHMQENYELNIDFAPGLVKLVGRLKKKYRDVVHLRYWSEMTFGEIAEYLGITESSAKVRHHRAIQKLQALSETYDE